MFDSTEQGTNGSNDIIAMGASHLVLMGITPIGRDLECFSVEDEIRKRSYCVNQANKFYGLSEE